MIAKMKIAVTFNTNFITTMLGNWNLSGLLFKIKMVKILRLTLDRIRLLLYASHPSEKKIQWMM